MNEFNFSEEVHAALNEHRPVVALESTIISHGMPYPENLAVARDVENEVRRNGAVPATIAILNGKICIGLEDESLTRLAQASDVMKCSRRDIPFAVSQQLNGATTVSATMLIAAMAGIDQAIVRPALTFHDQRARVQISHQPRGTAYAPTYSAIAA